MNKTWIYILAILVAAIELVWLGQQYQAQAKMRAENLALAAEAGRLGELTAENNRLTNTVSAAAAQATRNSQLDELNRLRGIVEGQHRELQALQTKLAAQTALPSFQSFPGSNRFVNLPRSSWTLAGYGTPEAALQSMLWAVSNGDMNAIRASLTPAELERRISGPWKDKTDAEIADAEIQGLSQASGIQILNIQMTSENDAHFTVYISGLPQSDQPLWLDLKQIDGQWKSDRLTGY